MKKQQKKTKEITAPVYMMNRELSWLRASQKRLEELMLDTSQLVKDVGTMLDGKEAVKEGLIEEVGGIKEALAKLYEMIEKEC